MIKLNREKLTLLFAVLSAVIIIVGVILYAVLGFNTSLDENQKCTVEVKYDVVVEVNEKEDELIRQCDTMLSRFGTVKREMHKAIVTSSLSETTDSFLVYTLPAGTDLFELNSLVGALRGSLAEDAAFEGAKIELSVHQLTSERFTEPAWRGAIAIAVGVIVALAYLAIRYGIDMGVGGLVCVAHDALFTLALLAICRIPVFSFMPVVCAAFAALVSVALWTYYCIRTKRALKAADNATLPRDLVYRKSLKEGTRPLASLALPLGFLVLIAFAVAVGAAIVTHAAAFLFTILAFVLAAAVPFYSVFLLGVEVCVPIRRDMEKRKANKKVRYIGKKKAETTK